MTFLSMDIILAMGEPEMLTEWCSCPICGFSCNTPFVFEEYNLQGEKVQLGINKCKNCYVIYTSPRLNQKGLDYIYNELYAADSGECIDDTIHKKDYQDFYTYALSIHPRGGKLLDMGCGVGNFLMQFQKNPAFQVQGVELSEYAVLEARQKSLSVIHGDARWIDLPSASFDLVSMLYVLEHLPDPVGLLKEANRLLRPGGIALIAVPNYNYLRLLRLGPVCRLIYKRPAYLQSHQHLVNFTPSTLSWALKKANFTPLKFFCGSPGAKGNWLKKILRTGMGLGAKAFFNLGVFLGNIHLIAKKTGDI